jgi:hypothetical protein
LHDSAREPARGLCLATGLLPSTKAFQGRRVRMLSLVILQLVLAYASYASEENQWHNRRYGLHGLFFIDTDYADNCATALCA